MPVDFGVWPVTFPNEVTSNEKVKEFLSRLKVGKNFHGFSEISLTTPARVANDIMKKAVVALRDSKELHVTVREYTKFSMQHPEPTQRYSYILENLLPSAAKVVANEENGWNPAVCRQLNDDIKQKRRKLGTRLIRLMVEKVLSTPLSKKIGGLMCKDLPPTEDASSTTLQWTGTYPAGEEDSFEFVERQQSASPWTFADWGRCYNLILAELTVGDLQGLNTARQNHRTRASNLSGDKLASECKTFVDSLSQQIQHAEEMFPSRRATEEEVGRVNKVRMLELHQTGAREGLAHAVEEESNLPARPARVSDYVRALENWAQSMKTTLRNLAKISLPLDARCRYIANKEAEQVSKWHARQAAIGLCIGDGGLGAKAIKVLKDLKFFGENGNVSPDYHDILSTALNEGPLVRALADDWKGRRSTFQKSSGRSFGGGGGAKSQNKSKPPAKRTSTNSPTSGSDSKAKSSKRGRFSKSKKSGKSNDSKKAGITCYNCNKPGHIKRNCPELQKDGSQ